MAANPIPPAGSPGAGPLARLPLQIGTNSVWAAGRAAAALFPGLALIGLSIRLLIHLADSDLRIVGAVGALGVMLVVYAVGYGTHAIRTRASDILLHADALRMDGGQHHGERIGWSELAAPHAEVEEATEQRLTIGGMLLVALSVLGETSVGGATSKVTVWRLYVHHNGQRRKLAQTDRPIERDSMQAAASSISAVVSGQKYVAEAPAVAAKILTCPGCGAPLVPDDTPQVACTFCGAAVPLPDDVRGQASAAKAMSQSRTTTTDIIAKLRAQPPADHTNFGMALVVALMFLAWPVGWGLIAFRVLADGFQGSDVIYLLLPFAAVLAGFFLARGRLADRGALQLLTLGFGALAPARPGQPPRCRRCQGPLADAGVGGVAHCRYCNSENIVGLDLRPTVDPARTEQATFDDALKKRSAEKRLWTALTIVSGLVLLVWALGTASYIARIEKGAPPAHAGGSHSKPPPGKHGH